MVRRPPSCWRLTRSTPPSFSASASRRRSSSSSDCQVTIVLGAPRWPPNPQSLGRAPAEPGRASGTVSYERGVGRQAEEEAAHRLEVIVAALELLRHGVEIAQPAL